MPPPPSGDDELQPSTAPFLVFGAPQILEDDIQEVVATLRSGWIGTGARTAQFRDNFRDYRKADHAVAVNSGTAALHLSAIAAKLQPGDEVITTALTFCATVNALIHAGVTPVLADVDPLTMNLDPQEVARRITPRTRAILPVHLAGRPCAMDELLALARQHDLLIIEDCAHAIETEYHGRAAGTIGDFGCFSFYVTKNLTTAEGGMVFTRSSEAAAQIECLALHGLNVGAWDRFGGDGYKHYAVVDCGFKFNMTDLQAALGISQLRRCESNWRRRADIWNHYNEDLRDLPLTLPAAVEPETKHAFHLFQVQVDFAVAKISRDEFMKYLTAQGIGVGVHYLSLPEHEYYRERFGWMPEDFPNALRIGRQTVSLPLSPRLSDADVQRVIATVRQALRC